MRESRQRRPFPEIRHSFASLFTRKSKSGGNSRKRKETESSSTREDEASCPLFLSTHPSPPVSPTPFPKRSPRHVSFSLPSCPSIGGNASTREKGKMNARKNTSGLFHSFSSNLVPYPPFGNKRLTIHENGMYITLLGFSKNDGEEV